MSNGTKSKIANTLLGALLTLIALGVAAVFARSESTRDEVYEHEASSRPHPVVSLPLETEIRHIQGSVSTLVEKVDELVKVQGTQTTLLEGIKEDVQELKADNR